LIWYFHAHVELKGTRMPIYDTAAPKRPVNVTLNSDLVARARAEGLNLSALAEEAVTAALAGIAKARFDAEIAQACRVHDQYLAEYGSLGEAVRAAAHDET
jgi:antitoxin CcdA